MIDEGPNEIDLQLTSQLEREGIVTRAVFYRKTSGLQVLLNHQYDSKSIVVSIDINDWNSARDIFEKALKRKGVKAHHIPLLSDILDENYHVIISQLDSQEEEEESKETIAQMALRLAVEKCGTPFMDQFGTPYTTIEGGACGINGGDGCDGYDHVEIIKLESSRFKNWLARTFYSQSEGKKILTGENISAVLSVLKARAEFDSGDRRQLHLRVASLPEQPNTIYYDLTNANWEYVKITPEGWDIVKPSKITPTIFTRAKNQKPQVYPTKPGDYPPDIFDKWLSLINLKKARDINDPEEVQKEKDAKILLKCYIIALFFEQISKAIEMAYGDQGAAKSSHQELTKDLVDPSVARTLAFPNDINELIQALANNYISYFDNVSHMPDWISDQLCRGATGAGFQKRELYTDNDDVIYDFKRPIGFNGVNLAATKSDLKDRGFTVQLERIDEKKRREDLEIRAEADSYRPQLLSYIFDILVEVLKVKQSGGIKLTRLPRMADYAKHCEIIARCMGYPEDTFLEAFNRNVKARVEESVSSNPVAVALIKFMEDKEVWKGDATGLLSELVTTAAGLNIDVYQKTWPRSHNALSYKLALANADLKELGVSVSRGTDTKTKLRFIEIRKTSSPSSPSSVASDIEENRAQIDSYVGDDPKTGSPPAGDDPSHRPPPENPENHTQNGKSCDGDDGDDLSGTFQEKQSSGSKTNEDSAYWDRIRKEQQQYGEEGS
jgi:hypothetical protein